MINYNNYKTLIDYNTNNYSESINNNYDLIGKKYNKKNKYDTTLNTYDINIELYIEKINKYYYYSLIKEKFIFIKSDSEKLELYENTDYTGTYLRVKKGHGFNENTDGDMYINYNDQNNYILSIDYSDPNFDTVKLDSDWTVLETDQNKVISLIRLSHLTDDSIVFKLINEDQYMINLNYKTVNGVISDNFISSETSNVFVPDYIDKSQDISVNTDSLTINDGTMICGGVFENITEGAGNNQIINDKLILFASTITGVFAEGLSGDSVEIYFYSTEKKEIHSSYIIENVSIYDINEVHSATFINNKFIFNYMEMPSDGSKFKNHALIFDVSGILESYKKEYIEKKYRNRIQNSFRQTTHTSFNIPTYHTYYDEFIVDVDYGNDYIYTDYRHNNYKSKKAYYTGNNDTFNGDIFLQKTIYNNSEHRSIEFDIQGDYSETDMYNDGYEVMLECTYNRPSVSGFTPEILFGAVKDYGEITSKIIIVKCKIDYYGNTTFTSSIVLEESIQKIKRIFFNDDKYYIFQDYNITILSSSLDILATTDVPYPFYSDNDYSLVNVYISNEIIYVKFPRMYDMYINEMSAIDLSNKKSYRI